MPNDIKPKLTSLAQKWFFAFYEDKRDGDTDEEYDRARKEVSRCLVCFCTIQSYCLKLTHI